jgi:hypothetical protein
MKRAATRSKIKSRRRIPTDAAGRRTVLSPIRKNGITRRQRAAQRSRPPLGFEVFVTADKNIRYQQNLAARRIALVVLSTPRWPLVRRHVDRIVAAVNSAARAAILKSGSRVRQAPTIECNLYAGRALEKNASRPLVIRAWRSRCKRKGGRDAARASTLRLEVVAIRLETTRSASSSAPR